MGQRPTQSRASRQKVTGALHEQKGLELRMRGYTYPQIAKELGVSLGAAFRSVERGLARLRAENTEQAHQLREIESARLDIAMVQAMRILENSRKPDQRLRAIDRVVKLIDRRARLWGLDAPTKHELTGADGKPVSLEALALNVAGKSEAELAEYLRGLLAQLDGAKS